MKQGTGHSSRSAMKVEPKSRSPNIEKVAGMGLQVVRTKPYGGDGRGFKAPMNKSTSHKGGSQGRY